MFPNDALFTNAILILKIACYPGSDS